MQLLSSILRAVKSVGSCPLLLFFAFFLFASLSVRGAGFNPIVAENLKPGNPPTEWDIGPVDPSIQGFATDISVNVGETVRFKVKTDAADYRIDIYRIGYYQGLGARLVTTITPSVPLPQSQPAPVTDPATGLVDCGNWAESASWAVPANAVSGFYIGKLVRPDTGGTSHIYFIVRNDNGGSDLLFQMSDTTWQAYNAYGGRNLYDFLGTSNPRAFKVSYNRPFITRDVIAWASLFLAEYPMIRWLEANGYNVSYTSGVDTHRRGSLLLQHRAFLSVGHDEYWSAGQRANVEAARAAGIHLAFFSANEIFWKVRWEPAIDGSGTPYKTMVCYKETKANAKIDPHPEWTGTWRDPRFSPPSDGGRPENLLSGTIFKVNGVTLSSLEVPADYGKHRFWRNTSVASLSPGQVAVFGPGTLGFEWDEAPDNAIPGLMRLSWTSGTGLPVLQDYGNVYRSGPATHSLTLYRHSSGALVFGAGTIHWSWGLDGEHDNYYYSGPPDLPMQQATVNLLADMGAQPGSIQAGLVHATASTDTITPSSVITSPAGGAVFEPGVPVTISGTASDAGGGQVWAVEVSLDNGTNWYSATGRANWTYAWTPATSGTYTIRTRAVDDSGNLETPAAGVAVTVPWDQLTIWPRTAVPLIVDGGPDSPIELGVKFRSAVGGTVTGIRFYKADLNQGVHVGTLWTTNGTKLASVTFTGETAVGWQQMNFPSPVPINANTVYIASYHAPQAHYSIGLNHFAAAGENNPPLQALADGELGGNGVYAYGPTSVFPNLTYKAANYWVDVAFQTPLAVNTPSLPGGIADNAYSAILAGIGGKEPYSWAISVGSLPPGLSLNGSSGVISGTPTMTGNFTFTVQISDSANPVVSATKVLSITVYPIPPLTIWPASAVPLKPDGGPDAPVELGVKFRSSVAGAITGIRFYKAPGNIGTHVGNLWTSNGTLLASATFTHETASGWQQVEFSTPVQISPNTVYVASYHCPKGHYSSDLHAFTLNGVDSPPLRVLGKGEMGDNGVYAYGLTSSFPTQSYFSANYWVDVAFQTPLVVTTPSLPNGVLDASYSGALSANSGKLPYTWAIVSGTLPPGLSLNPATGVITGTPTITGTFSFTAQVSDASNPAGTATKPFAITVYAAPGLSIWPSSAVPGRVDGGADRPVELGVKFRSDVAGTITGIRFYKSAANSGPHVGNLWSSSGTLLASAAFTSETPSGWQQVDFGTPVPISANTVYVASYHSTRGHYSIDNGAFAASGIYNPPLRALANGELGGNGVFAYGANSVFPSQSWGAANYWVDVAFQTPFAVGTASLPNATLQTAYSTTLGAMGGKQPYSWSIVSGALPGGLTLSASGVVSGSPTQTGTFNFTVQAQDTGNPVQTASKALSITVFAQALTIWPGSAVPGVIDGGADSPVQLGVKFRSDVAGQIIGVRFYKAPANTGTHVGSLWSTNGTRLASATFANESASGWQQVLFANPITIAPNIVYVASYHCTTGHYSLGSGYFAASGVDNPPLHALVNGAAGGNGVYGYGPSTVYPGQTYGSANYWVDVLFLPSP